MSGNSTFLCRDSSGGAAIQGFMGRTLELDEPGLFAIDFVDAPELEVIHIKRLDAGRQPHLTFYNLPSLRQVILPERQPPAIVHFASFAAPDMIVIEGRVSELDAAWKDTQFSMQSASLQQPWTRVVIRSASPEHDPVPAGGLVIMSGALPGTTDQLTLSAGSDWLLTDVSSLRHVQIDTDGQVSLQRLPRLTTVHSNIDGLTLHMENTPAVERVSGSGSILNLKQPVASATRLTINGGWKHARIFSPQLTTLHFANGHSLSLHDCGALKNVEVPHGIEVDCEGALPAPLVGFAHFYFNESSLNSCMQQFMQGDLSQLDGILSVLAKAHQRSQVAVTLQKLAELCHLGVAPERVWQTRRELAARHLRYGRKKLTGPTALAETDLRKADARWHWALAQDLAPQGWEADLNIWCYCQRSLPRAADYAQTIIRTCEDETACDALVRLGGNTQAEPALFAVAINVLEYRLRHTPDRGVRVQDHTSAPRLARLLGSPHADEGSRKIVVSFILEMLPVSNLISVVPSIMHLAPGLFRSKLMALTRRSDEWFSARLQFPELGAPCAGQLQQFRQSLLLIALAPCQAIKAENRGVGHSSADTSRVAAFATGAL